MATDKAENSILRGIDAKRKALLDSWELSEEALAWRKRALELVIGYGMGIKEAADQASEELSWPPK